MTDIPRAAQLLRDGKLVAFPTETVYGLGADATNAEAVARIFAAKGRPATNPLIVHVADAAVARRYAAAWPEAAEKLTGRFWPGPLTLVLPKWTPPTDQTSKIVNRRSIADLVTAGRSTVGLRAPDHPLALELLRSFDGPVAAPSANRSNRVSPTTAQHVRDELGDGVDLILDGGPCTVGIESTVLDLSTDVPTILRPGAVTAEQIESMIGPVRHFEGHLASDAAAASPGQQAVHYAPRGAAYRFDLPDRRRVLDWCRDHGDVAWAVLFLGPLDTATALSPDFDSIVVSQSPPAVHKLIQMPAAPRDYARRLYATLRELDEERIGVIWIQMPPKTEAWRAVRDRLTRATKPADEALLS